MPKARERYGLREAESLEPTRGPDACPLNHLYWDLLERQRARLKGGARMAVPLAALKRLPPAAMADHRAQAAQWREKARGG